jgi:hypothetical protein
MIRIAFAVGLILVSGAFADENASWDAKALWKAENPKFTERGSRDFQSNGPMLRSIRVSKRKIEAGETCEGLLSRIKDRAIGSPFELETEKRFDVWDGFSDDLDAVEDCDEFPCKVKLDEAETLAVAAKPEKARLAEVLKFVDARVRDYSKTLRRKGYDLPEDPVDPWKVFASYGHTLPSAFEKSKPTFFARKLKFGERNYRPLRQIFDERVFLEKDRVVRIARDIYTSHYFDGWGEWVEARCSKDGKTVYLLQDFLMEFDLLKNTDFLSRIARPKMRQGVDQESLRLQKEQATRLLAK